MSGVTKTCECCGREFGCSDFTYYINPAALSRRRFCSRSCRSRIVNRGRHNPQPTGPDSPSWRGANVTRQAGRKRARQLYAPRPCEVCGASRAERHHVDGDTTNNDPANVRFLCRAHHIAAEDRMAYARLTPEQVKERAERRRAQTRERSARYRARKAAAKLANS